jgi:Peptidase family C25
LLPAGMGVEEVTRGTGDDATVKSQLIGAINRGQTIVNYNGHGSVNQWRGDFLENGDAAGLTNSEKLAVFVMMTCMNGYYNDPALDSLAESLMRARGGAAAVWASTAQCEPVGQGIMNEELYRQMFTGGTVTLGEATMRAKQAVSDPDIKRTWILFGDPATRLR